VLHAVESDKAVADNLEEIEGLDGWLIKMGLKVDERVSPLRLIALLALCAIDI
jgi:hypothetical protein